MATFSQRCTLHANSGFASAVGGDYSAGTFLYTGDNSASFYDYLSYIRFTAVDIPAGSTIDSATLNLTAGTLSSVVVITTVKAEAADNPAACSSAADTNARTLTSASVNWDPSAWVVNTAYDSPDIAAVIQEVVNRNGWASGNAMQLFWSTRSTGWGGSTTLQGAYPDTGNGPLLTVNYTPRLGFDLRGPVPPGLRSPRTMRVVTGNTAAAVAATPPTWVPAGLTRFARFAPKQRGRQATPVPPQQFPPVVQPPRAQRRSLPVVRRGQTATPVPAQLNPPIVTPPARAQRRLLPVARRGTARTPVPAQQNPPIVVQSARSARRFGRARTSKVTTPPFAQAVVPPTWVPAPARAARRITVAFRSRTRPTPIPAQDVLPQDAPPVRRFVVARRRVIVPQPVPAQQNPPIVLNARRAPSRLGALTRRGKAATPVPPQLNPPIVTQPARNTRRLSALGRKPRTTAPIPTQDTPIIIRGRQVRVVRRRPGTATTPPLAQAAVPPTWVPNLVARFARNRPARRGQTVTPVPAQQNPPIVLNARRAPRRLADLTRRGKAATPVPAQAAAPPTFVPNPARPRRLSALGRRGTAPTPIPPQLNPPIVLNARRAPRRLSELGRRGKAATPVPAQQNPPIITPPARAARRLAALGRKATVSTPIPPQQNPPIVLNARRAPLRLSALGRRAKTPTPVPTQIPPPPITARTPPRAARRLAQLTRRGKTWLGWSPNPIGTGTLSVRDTDQRLTITGSQLRNIGTRTHPRLDPTGTNQRVTVTDTDRRADPESSTT